MWAGDEQDPTIRSRETEGHSIGRRTEEEGEGKGGTGPQTEQDCTYLSPEQRSCLATWRDLASDREKGRV